MASIAILALFNGAAVPISKNFVPSQKFGGPKVPAIWKLKEGASPLGWSRVEISETRSSRGSRHVNFKVVVPYVVTIDGVPTLVATCLYDSSSNGYIIPEGAVQSQIDDLYGYVKSLTASAVLGDWVKSQDPAF